MSYGYHRLGSNVPGKVMPDALSIDLDRKGIPASAAEPYIEPSQGVLTLMAMKDEIHTEIAKVTGISMAEFEPGPAKPKLDERKIAILSGYTGDSCSRCAGMRMRRNGTCMVCEECGTTTGCS
jgi:ribonucleoside-diphosphate reductase alpha chain